MDYLLHVFRGRSLGQVDGFGDRVVGMTLKRGLHANVNLWRQVVARDEQGFEIGRQSWQGSERAGSSNLSQDLRTQQVTLLQGQQQRRVHLL